MKLGGQVEKHLFHTCPLSHQLLRFYFILQYFIGFSFQTAKALCGCCGNTSTGCHRESQSKRQLSLHLPFPTHNPSSRIISVTTSVCTRPISTHTNAHGHTKNTHTHAPPLKIETPFLCVCVYIISLPIAFYLINAYHIYSLIDP